MKPSARRIEVRTADDKLIFSLRLYDDEANGSSAGSGDEQKKRDANGGKGPNDFVAMTESQKRYLFRILAERGLEGDDAHQHLKERFGANALTDVSKREASSMIEQLLEEGEAKAK
jgi:hypothetical protein